MGNNLFGIARTLALFSAVLSFAMPSQAFAEERYICATVSEYLDPGEECSYFKVKGDFVLKGNKDKVLQYCIMDGDQDEKKTVRETKLIDESFKKKKKIYFLIDGEGEGVNLVNKVESKCPENSAGLGSTKVNSADPTLGRCHMDSCSWSKTLSKEEITSDDRGKLIKLKLLGGESPNDDKKPKIKWNKDPHEVYIFCSTRLPAVIMASGEKLQVDVLDFWGGIPGVYESDASLYRETCHSGSANMSDEELARKFKYSPSPESDITISKPAEIFGYVKPNGKNPPVSLPAFANNTGTSNGTLVVDGTTITYKPVPEIQQYGVTFQMDSKGYRNIYRLDCQGRKYLWTNNIELRTNQETTNTAGAEWKMMSEKSTITNAVYEAICPQLLGYNPADSVPSASENPQFELEFWSSVKNSDDLADFQAYLDKYPKGQFQELARRRIDRLREASDSSPPASAMTMGGLTPITKPKLISERALSASIEGEYNGEFHGYLTVRHSARPNYYTVWLGVGAGSCGGETLVDNKDGLLEGNRISFNWQQKQRPCTTVITFGDSSANVSDSCISPQSEENSTCAMMGEYQKTDAT